MLKIQVIIGSIRPNRFSDKPAYWIADELNKQEGVEAELVDLKDYPLPFFEAEKSPMNYGNDYPNKAVEKWATKINEADGYVIVTPEYNYGYPSVLKNAIDYAYQEWNKKPVGFIGFGGVGGARAVEQLRQVVVGLKMMSIYDAVHMGWDVYGPISGETVPVNPELFKPVQHKADAMISDLIWWGNALKTAREKDN